MELLVYYIIAAAVVMFLCGIIFLIAENEIFAAVIISVFLGVPVVVFILTKSYKHFKYKYSRNKDDEY